MHFSWLAEFGLFLRRTSFTTGRYFIFVCVARVRLNRATLPTIDSCSLSRGLTPITRALG